MSQDEADKKKQRDNDFFMQSAKMRELFITIILFDCYTYWLLKYKIGPIDFGNTVLEENYNHPKKLKFIKCGVQMS